MHYLLAESNQMVDFANVGSAVFTAIAAIASVVAIMQASAAARQAYAQADAAAKLAHNQAENDRGSTLLVHFLQWYDNPDIAQAMRMLSLFSSGATPDQLAKKIADWAHARKSSLHELPSAPTSTDLTAANIDWARRIIKSYFVGAVRLEQGGLVGRKFLHAVCERTGLDLFYRIVQPMEAAMNAAGITPRADSVPYVRLRQVMDDDKLRAASFRIDSWPSWNQCESMFAPRNPPAQSP